MECAATLLDGPASARARYLANLAALYAADPELAVRIDALPFSRLPLL